MNDLPEHLVAVELDTTMGNLDKNAAIALEMVVMDGITRLKRGFLDACDALLASTKEWPGLHNAVQAFIQAHLNFAVAL